MSRTITYITAQPFGSTPAKGDKLAAVSGLAAYALALLQLRTGRGPMHLDNVYRVLLRAMEMHHIDEALAELEKAGMVKRGYREELVPWRELPTHSRNGGKVS